MVATEALTPSMRELGLMGWVQVPEWPFWRTGKPADLQQAARAFRRTEIEMARPGTQPKSVFQLVGAGQVRPGSLYGMQALDTLARSSFSIWPFDVPRLPLVLEIFPRTLTGPVVKSDPLAREAYLAAFELPSEIRRSACASEDAFDALLSAVQMSQHVEQIRDLAQEPEYGLEGKIWTVTPSPVVVAPTRGLPFERYRGGGRQLLGRAASGDGTCRRGYGPPVFSECGMDCAYCDRNMGESYESWLNVSIDHVIPSEAVKRLGWPREWVEDIANVVTCCRACNEFLNGYRIADPPPVTVDMFFELRDQHFSAKRTWVIERHVRERESFELCTHARRGSRAT
jgi:hypothetical protein